MNGIKKLKTSALVVATALMLGACTTVNRCPRHHRHHHHHHRHHHAAATDGNDTNIKQYADFTTNNNSLAWAETASYGGKE